jgi:hypothetical protein
MWHVNFGNRALSMAGNRHIAAAATALGERPVLPRQVLPTTPNRLRAHDESTPAKGPKLQLPEMQDLCQADQPLAAPLIAKRRINS